MRKALERIANQLTGISTADLTTAEVKILNIVSEALDWKIEPDKYGQVRFVKAS